MNEILTAKEWLEKEGVFPYNHFTIEDDINKMPRTEDIMERYANYRTKMLKEKFSKYWRDSEMKILELEGKLRFIENIPKDKNYTQLL